MAKAAGDPNEPSREALFRAAFLEPLSRIQDPTARKEARRVLAQFFRSMRAHPNLAATHAGLLHRLNKIFREHGVVGSHSPIRPALRKSKTKIGFLSNRKRRSK